MSDNNEYPDVDYTTRLHIGFMNDPVDKTNNRWILVAPDGTILARALTQEDIQVKYDEFEEFYE